MVKQIRFDPQGERLWINVEMFGIYFITYTYQLWSADKSQPPILTNPIKSGSNANPHDDFYQVINDYNTNEPVDKYIDRTIDVRFWIKQGNDDNGYHLKVTVLQGNQFENAQELDFDEVSGTNGSSSIKQEFLTIQLIN